MTKQGVTHILLKAVLAMGCFFVIACENNYQEVQALGMRKIGVEEGRGIQSYLSQNGVVKAKLTAPLMLRYMTDTPRTVFPKTLHVMFYDSTGNWESQLFSRFGQYLENESKVFLKDSVRVFNRSGDTLRCRELYWDQSREIFFTDKNVIIQKPDQKIYGTGLTADQNFKWFTINNAHGFINIPDSTFLAE